jgi:protein transport protein SEC24
MPIFGAERYEKIALLSKLHLFIYVKGTIPLLENDFSQRVNAVIAKTREMRRGVYRPYLFIIKEDGEPPLRSWALSALIQDRHDSTPSYAQYLTQLKDKVREE